MDEVAQGLRHLSIGAQKRLERLPGTAGWSNDNFRRAYYEAYETLIDKLFSEDAAIGFLSKCYQNAEDNVLIYTEDVVSGDVLGVLPLEKVADVVDTPITDEEMVDMVVQGDGVEEAEVEPETPKPTTKPKPKVKGKKTGKAKK